MSSRKTPKTPPRPWRSMGRTGYPPCRVTTAEVYRGEEACWKSAHSAGWWLHERPSRQDDDYYAVLLVVRWNSGPRSWGTTRKKKRWRAMEWGHSSCSPYPSWGRLPFQGRRRWDGHCSSAWGCGEVGVGNSKRRTPPWFHSPDGWRKEEAEGSYSWYLDFGLVSHCYVSSVLLPPPLAARLTRPRRATTTRTTARGHRPPRPSPSAKTSRKNGKETSLEEVYSCPSAASFG